jgi:aminoglycoside N3'-acetyltransferase
MKVLARQLRDLGVDAGDIVLVHSSFRAIRPVEGGPDGVTDALVEAVGPEGTIVMPSWTDEDDEIFDVKTTDVDEHLGIVAEMIPVASRRAARLAPLRRRGLGQTCRVDHFGRLRAPSPRSR